MKFNPEAGSTMLASYTIGDDALRLGMKPSAFFTPCINYASPPEICNCISSVHCTLYTFSDLLSALAYSRNRIYKEKPKKTR
ncbi:hypothetical protein SD81_004120 [Tolypothrix campylonemoides VB511288]|nr:hypothetical protein SD81_004120 [Tolypothrix campylonemoides VB511288]